MLVRGTKFPKVSSKLSGTEIFGIIEAEPFQIKKRKFVATLEKNRINRKVVALSGQVSDKEAAFRESPVFVSALPEFSAENDRIKSD